MPTQKINVGGVAVRAGLSLNRILYTPEVLQKFAPTLTNKPILKDHSNLTDSTIGLVTQSAFEPSTTKVRYNGWVKEDGTGILEKIDDGRIKEVSIGGVVGRLVKENLDDDFYIAKDMKAMELSTTPTPAVVGTSISQTLKGLSEVSKPEDWKKVKPVFERVEFIAEKYEVGKEEVKEKIIEKFMCPLCENTFPTIEELRIHMKTHSQEPDGVSQPKGVEPKPNSKTKLNLEERKMAEDELNVDEKQKILEAKESDLKKREHELKSREDSIAKERREKLEQEYDNLIKVKKVTSQDISKLSNETIKALIEMLKVLEQDDDDKVKCPECGKMLSDKKALAKHMDDEHPEEEEEEKKKKAKATKGKVDIGSEEKDTNVDGFAIEKSEFGSGFSLYRESYPDKFKRLLRS